MKEGIILLFGKLLDIFHKKSKSGDKQQEITEKKINIYSKAITIVIITALIMCVLASLFPELAISDWWFNILEKLLNSVG
ncbi:hypothetical protein [Fusobacterium sp.]|jgi:ABC-type lipoprotein release transport system permease subunit|uniref:hypothetical protein n=1 Tax=Fusobacterium sp. TaxID=68766 RepID=UPI0020453FE3|nr:hypothetical protein [Fusobacterium sp.]DAL55957.1 MAG TPA_asm: hypothetical protein [Caudoviricetes sp.]